MRLRHNADIDLDTDGLLAVNRSDYSSPTPLYHRIYLVLRSQIVDAVLQPGDLLPSEGAIAEEFDVSRITAKRALDELAKEGLVTRARGKGTTVTANAARFLQANFSDLVENLIEISVRTKVKVLKFDYGPAPRHVQKALNLPEKAVVQHAVRVRHQGTTPFSYIETYIPEDVGRSFGANDLSNRPILSLIEKAGVEIAQAEQSVNAVLADGKVAAILETPPASPLLKIVRVVSDSSGRPVQYIELWYRQDCFQINMKLERVAGEGNTRIWKFDSSPALD